MKSYVLSIDQGTTSSRAILFDKNAKIHAVSQKELKLYYPKNGWVEQDAKDIWNDTKYVCHEILKENNLTADDIDSIGITNQRETIILWDKQTGEPLYNAIVWQDRRTADYCAELKEQGLEDKIINKTGLLLDPYFSGTKLKWLLDNLEGARDRADRGELLAGTVDCYLVWKMTGNHKTDITNASRTMLYNIVEQCWDNELLDILDIPLSLMPEVNDNIHLFGNTEFLGKDLPITGIAGDQQSALIGQACFEKGMVKSTYGTGCFILMNIGEEFKKSKNKMLTTIAYRINGKINYAIEGSIFNAGTAIQWLRDGLNIIDDAKDSEDAINSVKDNGGVYFVPAFTGLGAPYWNPEARGMIYGITRDSNKNHVIRAALEAQAYQTKDLISAMADDAGYDITEIKVDGGMVANNFLCQFLSDITDVKIKRPEILETTAMGSAYLAGLYTGFYKSMDDIIAGSNNNSEIFEPSINNDDRDMLYSGWQDAMNRVIL